MVISGVFFLFTVSLLAAHTRLLLLNLTTVEELPILRMKARERATLAREFGFWNYRSVRFPILFGTAESSGGYSHIVCGNREKEATQKRWDKEWGRIGREGNLWFLGSLRENWESVMGKAKLGWFRRSPHFAHPSRHLLTSFHNFVVPIAASPIGDDGLSYVPNPRFSEEGFWRRRKYWPRELR